MPTLKRDTLGQRMERAREQAAADRAARSPGWSPTLPMNLPAPAASPPQPRHWQVPAKPGEIVMLMPGEMHFGNAAASLRTLLGSCVAVTLWHPGRRLGGMCHFLLPSRQRKVNQAPDGRYGDEALEAMVQSLRAARTEPGEYEAHLYGGADTMPEGGQLKFNVGERNIEQGWSLIDQYGFRLQGVDVGENVPRTVTLTMATGEVAMKRGHGGAPQPHLNTPSPLTSGGRITTRST
jgi:chemotaxis protein CheD